MVFKCINRLRKKIFKLEKNYSSITIGILWDAASSYKLLIVKILIMRLGHRVVLISLAYSPM